MRSVLLLTCAALAVSACDDGGVAAGGGRWERTVAPANGLSGLDAVRVGGKVVVVGGADYDQTEVKALVLDLWSGRWSRAARSGLPCRAGHSVVAANGEVIVWGGGPGTGAAAYDVSLDSWRRIPPGPLAGRTRHSAVWTGDEMVVWGGSGPVRRGRTRVLSDGAAYNPDSDTWRRISPAPLHSAPARTLHQTTEVELDAVWTGSRMFVWNGFAGGTYAPRSDRWRPLPPPPPRLRYRKPSDSAVWTGRRLIVFGGTAPDNHARFIADAAAYDPARARWTMLPPAPIAGRDRHAAVWTGTKMLVFGGCCRGSRHHRDGALYRPR
jgi:hypothetical protein